MKKIIVLTILLLVTANVYAESPTDKGVYSLGGSISYRDMDSDDGFDYKMYQFAPSFRYFIFDNIAIGTSLTYVKTKGTGIFDGESYGIGPTFRYYLPNKKINPFIEANYSYLKDKDDDSKSTSNEFSIGIGLDYFISKNVSIEPTINYSWRDYKYNYDIGYINDRDVKTLYIGIGINLFIF